MKIKTIALATGLAIGAMAAPTANASLSMRAAYQDAALAIDGFAGSSGVATVSVASGSTVQAAYLYSADVWGSGNASVTFNGSVLNVASSTLLTPNVNSANTVMWDVTSIVSSVINGGAGGNYDFSIAEGGNLDGEVLVVVYKNPSTVGGTAIIMDGELATTGDTVHLGFASPYSSGDVIMSLASSFSYNGSSTVNSTGQVTTVDVVTSSQPTRRLTSCAGGNDDGAFVAANGQLLTVGGTDDSTANPDPNCAGGAGDDELYNLGLGNSANAAPFLTSGDTFLDLITLNPSNDDNVFFLGLTSTFRVSDVNDDDIDDDDDNNVPEPASLGLAGLALLGAAAARRRNRR